MNEILGYVQPPRSNQIYACGYRWTDDFKDSTTASLFQMSTDGDVSILYAFGDATKTKNESDVCRAAAYDERKEEVVFALEVTSKSLRPNLRDYSKYASSNTDVTIIRMKPGGKLVGAHNINFYTAGISIGVGSNSLFTIKDAYYFGSQSSGFKTRNQNFKSTSDGNQLDTNLFRWTPRSSGCLYDADMNEYMINNAVASKFTDGKATNKFPRDS